VCAASWTWSERNASVGQGHRSAGRGVLGVIAVRVDGARHAVGLLNVAHTRGLQRAAAPEVVVRADALLIPVGIDGETVQLTTPVRCTIRPGALRVRLPRERPGIRPPRGRLDWATLWNLALGRSPGAHVVPHGDRPAPLGPGQA
jgi:hypothetical protein